MLGLLGDPKRRYLANTVDRRLQFWKGRRQSKLLVSTWVHPGRVGAE